MTNHTTSKKLNTTIVKYSWYIAITVVLLLFAHTYLTTTIPSESYAPPSDHSINQQPVKLSNLGLTADEFQSLFNQKAKENKLDLEIKSLQVQKGLLQNTFQYMLTDDIVLIGNVDGINNDLQKITVLSTSTETVTSNLLLGSTIRIVIALLTPTLPTAEQAELYTTLGLSGKSIKDIEIIQADKRYFYKPSDKLGTLFIISPIH